MHDEPVYISIQEAAKRLSVEPRFIRKRIATGQIAGYRGGTKLIRVKVDEIDALLTPIPTAGSRAVGGGDDA